MTKENEPHNSRERFSLSTTMSHPALPLEPDLIEDDGEVVFLHQMRVAYSRLQHHLLLPSET